MIIAEPGQNIIQIATIKHNAGYAFYLALRNKLAVTDAIIAGQKLFESKIEKSNFLSFEQLLIEKGIPDLNDIIVYPNQSLIDIAMQEDGSAFSAFQRAIENKINITDFLIAGDRINNIIPLIKNSKVAKLFKGLNQKIATSTRLQQITELDYFDYLLPGELPYSL